jgi:hypothetical protein
MFIINHIGKKKMLEAVLRIRISDPGSGFFNNGPGIQGQNWTGTQNRIHRKYLLTQIIVTNTRKYDQECLSRIRILIRIPDPGLKKHRIPDPGSGSPTELVKWGGGGVL